MEQRDILKDQIEQLGRVLGKILAVFFDLKTQGNVSDAIQVTNQELKSGLDLDADRLIQMGHKEMEAYLETKKLADSHLDQLSNYFFEIGMHKKACDDHENSFKYFKTAKKLLEWVDERSSLITFERLRLKEKIENELRQNL